MPSLLTTNEVAALCRVTPRTVRRWGEAGLITQVSVGPLLNRYTLESVAALIGPALRREALLSVVASEDLRVPRHA